MDVDFEIIGKIEAIEIIAVGSKIRVLAYLQKYMDADDGVN